MRSRSGGPRSAGHQDSDPRWKQHKPALPSRLRQHDLVRGWPSPRTRECRAALPHGVTVTPSCPLRKPSNLRKEAVLRRRLCGGTHFKKFRRKKFKILGRFPRSPPFPMGHVTSPPHCSGPSHAKPSPRPSRTHAGQPWHPSPVPESTLEGSVCPGGDAQTVAS